jgi:trehalose 6-phosphate phosphatase
MRLDPDGEVETRGKPMTPDIVEKFHELALRLPGTTFENKVYGGCLHLGSSAAPRDLVEEELSAILAGHEDMLNIFYDQRGCEIRQNVANKGTAIKELLNIPVFKGKVPIYIGDDFVDCEAFSAVKDAGGTAVHVGNKELFPAASLRLSSVKAVYKWLKAVVNIPSNENEAHRIPATEHDHL